MRKLKDERMDRTDGETDKDESDFIGRCSTNVERPTIFKKKIKFCG